jgi:hypothetical protein
VTHLYLALAPALLKLRKRLLLTVHANSEISLVLITLKQPYFRVGLFLVVQWQEAATIQNQRRSFRHTASFLDTWEIKPVMSFLRGA